MRQSLAKAEEGKGADGSFSRSLQEMGADPLDLKNASPPKDSLYLASEVARTNPNRMQHPCRWKARTVDTGNGVIYDSDADFLWTRRRLKQALEAEAFWAGGIGATYTMMVTTGTRSMDVTAKYNGIVPSQATVVDSKVHADMP